MKISGFNQIGLPTFQEVVNNAAFVNGPPIPNPPHQLALSSGRQLLFPSMNFTCSGTITRLTFLGWLNESSDQFSVTNLTSWPYFSLWHSFYAEDGFMKVNGIGPDRYDSLRLDVMLNENDHQLVKVTLRTNVMVTEGNILGVQLQQNDSLIKNGIDMTVLKEPGGYGLTLVCDNEITSCYEEFEIPYIYIQTGEMYT